MRKKLIKQVVCGLLAFMLVIGVVAVPVGAAEESDELSKIGDFSGSDDIGVDDVDTIKDEEDTSEASTDNTDDINGIDFSGMEEWQKAYLLSDLSNNSVSDNNDDNINNDDTNNIEYGNSADNDTVSSELNTTETNESDVDYIIDEEQVTELADKKGITVEELLRTASATAELDGNVVKVNVKPKYNDTVIQSYSLYSNDKRCAFPSVDVSDKKFTCELPEGYSGTYFVIVETSEGTINSNVFGVANEVGNEIEISDIGNDADYTEGNFAVNLSGLPEICNEGDTVTITISTDIPVLLEFNGVAVGRGIYNTSFDIAVSSNGIYEYRAVNENNEEVTGSIEVNCFKPVEESSSNIGIIIAAVVVILIAVVIILLLLSRKRAKEGAEESEITEEDL